MQEKNVLEVRPISAENFSDLGQVITIPVPGERVPTLEKSFFRHYAALAFLDCYGPVELGITTFRKRELKADKLEQHAGTPELLYAIDGDFVMPVAPSHMNGKVAAPDLTRIRAIRVRQGEGLIFQDGMWHWAPFPVQKDPSSVLVGFKIGTAENDILIHDLDHTYIMILDEPESR